MQKLSTFIFSCICAVPLLGAPTSTSLPISESRQSDLPAVNEDMVRKYLTGKSHTRVAPPMKTDTSDQIIYEAPEGTVVNYATTGTSYLAIMGYIGTIPVEDFVTEIVYCEDGSVYWRNAITMIAANTYIKGTDQGDRLVFDLPQAVILNPEYPDEEGNPTLAYAQRMKYNEEDQFYYVNEEDQTVSLIKNEDGSLTADLNGYDIIGMTTPDGIWYGYGNYNTVLSLESENVAVTPPEGIKTEEWMLISDYIGRKVELGFDGNDVYIHNPVLPDYDDPGLIPDYWIKGTIADGEITIPEQYIGHSDLLMVSIYFSPAILVDEETFDKFDVALLKYDDSAKVMTSDVGFSLTARAGYIFGYTETPEIRWQPEDISLNLTNPVIVDAFNYDETIRYGVFAFNLPAMNKDGYFLNPDYIFTRFYVDDEPYIFTPEDYDIEEPMEWVPFLFNDGWDFHQYGQYHRFDLYFDGAESMGIQAKYDDGNNVYFTDIISTSLATSVKDLKEDLTEADNNVIQAEDTIVYSVNGMKCSSENLKPGIYIVRTPKATKKLVIK